MEIFLRVKHGPWIIIPTVDSSVVWEGCRLLVVASLNMVAKYLITPSNIHR